MLANRIIAILSTISIISLYYEATAGGPIIAGPRAGERLPGMVHSLSLAKKDVETQECFVCRYGEKPVVLIFAREFNESLFGMIKQLDSAAKAKRDNSFGVFVVFYGDTVLKQRDELARHSEKHKLTETVLSIYPAELPRGYFLPPEAAVTVLVCRNLTVRTNFAFRTNGLKESDVKAVLKSAGQVSK